MRTPQTRTNAVSPRRRSRLHTVAAAALAAAFVIGVAQGAGAIDPEPVPEPTDPTPSLCVNLTTATFTSSKGPFEGGTELAWNATKGCSDVVLKLGTETVGRTGSVVKDPVATTEYRLVATLGGFSKTLGTKYALGGDIVGYALGRGGVVEFKNPTGPDAVEARRISGTITRAISPAAQRALVGKTLETHIIPSYLSLTALPPWKHLAGQMTCDPATDVSCVAPRPYSAVRGIGATRISGTNRIATAVGQEELVPVASRPNTHALGHILAHELGHTVFAHGVPTEKAAVVDVLSSNPPDHDYLGYDEYTKSSYQEYFAEGTAALFRFEYGSGYDAEYTPEWLSAHEPELLEILRRVYPGAG